MSQPIAMNNATLREIADSAKAKIEERYIHMQVQTIKAGIRTQLEKGMLEYAYSFEGADYSLICRVIERLRERLLDADFCSPLAAAAFQALLGVLGARRALLCGTYRCCLVALLAYDVTWRVHLVYYVYFALRALWPFSKCRTAATRSRT